MKDLFELVSGDNESNFENLLDKNKELTIHQRNFISINDWSLQKMIGCAQPIMDNFFILREMHTI